MNLGALWRIADHEALPGRSVGRRPCAANRRAFEAAKAVLSNFDNRGIADAKAIYGAISAD